VVERCWRAVADEASARASVNDAQAALSTDQINLSKASIRAPSDGVVLTRSVEPGNAVAASLQAVTLFTVAEDLAQLRLQVYVDEADVGAVKVGQEAQLHRQRLPESPVPGQDHPRRFGSTITDNVVTYLTYLDVDNSDLSLRPGMTATATITATERKDVLLVPNRRCASRPTAADAGQTAKKNITASLMPRMPGSRTRKIGRGRRQHRHAKPGLGAADGSGGAAGGAITPGISDGRMTEITGGDLQVGMQVITDQKTAAAK
jgi:HlyD family secretion protein